MTGETLRKRLLDTDLVGRKIVFSQLADQLGITRQAFRSKLKAEKVDYWFVEKLANALGIDKKVLTGEELPTTAEPNTTFSTGNIALDKLMESSQAIANAALDPKNIAHMSKEDQEVIKKFVESFLKAGKVLSKKNNSGQ